MEPIVIVGLAFKMPQDAVDETGFWEVLESRRNLMTEWPESRCTVESFYDGGSGKANTLRGRGAHFLKEDPAVFDAPFFSITAKEAASMDPQQRKVLETAYHAFENAGIPVDSLRGSRTAVFGASMSDDYARILSKDPDMAPRMTATGIAPSLLPNRVSWYFHLRGPSMQIDTACSSSLVALDCACQSIRHGDASAALIFGSSMLLSPESTVLLSNMNFLSPDSQCYSFDHRASGYARGEGVVAIVVKPLRDALRDRDVIRAVIRGTGANQDGRTPGLTQPSAEAQEMLIRHVYQKAGLTLQDTRYIEAHGTGTPTGDPIEMKAIGRVFRPHRSRHDPLYVGSVKANIGHLEGASGLAGVVKAVLALEKGVIPPNALFEKMNQAIDADFYHIIVPTEKTAWPTTGLRRASVNSFGIGGANAHVILDDAFHYLQGRGLVGYHNCMLSSVSNASAVNGTTYSTTTRTWDAGEPGRPTEEEKTWPAPRLLVWTASDAAAIERVIDTHKPYYQTHIAGRVSKLGQLAYTLAARRSHMPWRTFAVVDDDAVVRETPDTAGSRAPQQLLAAAKPVRMSSERLAIAFIFTGQGAQHVGMGLELLCYPVFSETLRRVDAVFAGLGCPWSLFDALRDGERIHHPAYSQPLCTALQLALVELLKSFGVNPTAVVGHSSGEIAAAYTVGALSLESACKVAYCRGQVAGKLQAEMRATPGAMMAVNLREAEVQGYLEKNGLVPSDAIHLACVNSPTNCTLSGAEEAIDKVKHQLDSDGIFAQKLDTGVAYHSPTMRAVATEYLTLMGALDAGSARQHDILMISSVTGHAMEAPKLLSTAQYWVDNLVSPVRFADAMHSLVQGTELKVGAEGITDMIEVGPHAALRRPVADTLHSIPVAPAGDEAVTGRYAGTKDEIRYHAVLQRAQPPSRTILTLLGALFCHGHPVSIVAGNGHGVGTSPPPPQLVNCPQYPFDHSRTYWTESRLSKDFRLRGHSTGHLLGRRAHDWNALRPSFRNWLSVETLPWLGDHVISNTTICPGAGMIVMALEAVRQMAGEVRGHPITGFLVKEAHFLQPIPVPKEAGEATEMSLHLRPVRRPYEKESAWSEITIFAHHGGRWAECFRADVQVQYEAVARQLQQVDGGLEKRLERERIVGLYERAAASCTAIIEPNAFYDFLRDRGLDYGPAFRLLQDMRWDGQDTSAARIEMSPAIHQVGDSPVHPAVLDAATHLILAQVSKGMSGPTPTLVPQRLGNAWISAAPWAACQGASARLACIMRENSSVRVEGSLYALADDGTPLCAIERIDMVPVSQDNSDTSTLEEERISVESGPTKLLYEIEWKPQFSTLRGLELQRLLDSQAPAAGRAEAESRNLTILESTLRKAARRALSTLSDAPPENNTELPGYLRKFAASLRQRYGQDGQDGQDGQGKAYVEDSDEQVRARFAECEERNPAWRMFTAVGCNLTSILRGDGDPLELLFHSNAVDDFYADGFDDICDARLSALLDLASHERPSLRVLEVGAGTGSMTHHVLAALKASEQRTGTARFAEYTYTDLSPAFFADARARFAGLDLAERLVFRKLDLERDPRAQEGFAAGDDEETGYDMVIAGSVLHATSDLAATLDHVRALLRPGGRLVMAEITEPERAWAHVGFGTLSGWWMATEEWRQEGPLVEVDRWDTLVKGAGFTGVDACWRNYLGISLMVATAAEGEKEMASTIAGGGSSSTVLGHAGPCRQRLVLITDPGQDAQQAISTRLGERWEVHTVCLDDVLQNGDAWAGAAGAADMVVSILEVGAPRLTSLEERDFQALQALIRQSQNLLWVAGPGRKAKGGREGDDDDVSPHYGSAAGFLRVVRSEEPSKHIVTLTVKSQSCLGHETTAAATAATYAGYVEKVIDTCFPDMSTSSPSSSELDLEVRDDGFLAIGRLAHVAELDADRRAHVTPALRREPWMAGQPLALAVGTPGMLDTLRFVEDDKTAATILAPGEVEIEARAWTVSFRDVFIALGRLGADAMGSECAGVVTRVGASDASAAAADFRPGDRVFLVRPGCMRMYPRAPAEAVFRIADSVSFSEAVAAINPGITAYHALLDVARLQKGETVLIHSAAGATGQMAVQIARHVGAEVFATVGFDDKKQLLMDTFGIPADHIFHSRDAASFARGVMRITGGRGVDVVLNSLSGDGLRASWECVAPRGRFLEIGKVDIGANTALPMGGFAKNVSFCAVDLLHIVQTDAHLTRRLVKAVMELIVAGQAANPTPLHVYPAGEVERAFRFVQGGRNTGRVVVEVRHGDEVDKFIAKQNNWRFDANASYLVAGGLGGLGREMIRWMAGKGAKNLVLPSRSGISSKAAAHVVQQLHEMGVRVMAPQCDVGSASELAAVLRACEDAGMPPIRGCINSAMALQDAVFEGMTHAQWQRTIQSKVNSSWNLHQQLPADLDFFVLLSSLSGIYGSLAQSNYAAGCTFQDALARYRGRASVSLDLGWMRDAGIVAEREDYRRNRNHTRDMNPVDAADLMALLDHYCDPARADTGEDGRQLLVGAITPVDMRLRGEPSAPFEALPLLAGFAAAATQLVKSQKLRRANGHQQGQQLEQQSAAQRFRQAAGPKARAAVVADALIERLARALSVAIADIDARRPLPDYGVDSLMAVELRNWIRRDFGAAVAVFDIMGAGTSIAGVGELVAERGWGAE